MTEPEPLDEYPASLPETRGGDRLADITVPEFAEGGPVRPDVSAMHHRQNADGSFCCDEDEGE